MKYMILAYASQRDYDAMAGKPRRRAGLDREDFAAMGEFMEQFAKDLAESGELVETRALAAPVPRPADPAAPTACRWSPTARTPRPRRCSPGTGSSSATASTGRPRSPPAGRAPRARARPRAGVRRRPADRRSRGTNWTADVRRCRAPASRTCCATWRRRSSARWSRRYGHFDLAEDAVQEALLAAATPVAGRRRPGQPPRLADHRRRPPADRPAARRAGPAAPARRPPRGGPGRPVPGAGAPTRRQAPTTRWSCCSCAATPRCRRLADRADPARGRRPDHRRDRPRVPGARGDDDPADHPGEAGHRGQRHPVHLPEPGERADRLAAVLQVLYLIFNEGYASTSGPGLLRRDLSAEAIRLARMLRALLPDDAEVTGLLALMLLTDARRPAAHRPGGLPGPDGRAGPRPVGRRPDRRGRGPDHRGAAARAAGPVPAPGGDRRPARRGADAPRRPTGRRSWRCTRCCCRLSDNPVVALNHAVAVAMVHGPRVGLDLLENARRGRADRGRRTGCTPSGPTCWRWPATWTPPGTPTCGPPS